MWCLYTAALVIGNCSKNSLQGGRMKSINNDDLSCGEHTTQPKTALTVRNLWSHLTRPLEVGKFQSWFFLDSLLEHRVLAILYVNLLSRACPLIIPNISISHQFPGSSISLDQATVLPNTAAPIDYQAPAGWSLEPRCRPISLPLRHAPVHCPRVANPGPSCGPSSQPPSSQGRPTTLAQASQGTILLSVLWLIPPMDIDAKVLNKILTNQI